MSSRTPPKARILYSEFTLISADRAEQNLNDTPLLVHKYIYILHVLRFNEYFIGLAALFSTSQRGLNGQTALGRVGRVMGCWNSLPCP